MVYVPVDDQEIVDLFFARDENAVSAASKKYSHYCRTVSYNVLGNSEDAEECTNDTFLKAWKSIPPTRPRNLKSFLGKIARNISLDRYDASKTAKRYPSQYAVALEELSECIPDTSPNVPNDISEIRTLLNSFLEELKPQKRVIFVKRYWYLESINDIADETGVSVSNVKSILHRERRNLKKLIEKEGISL